MAPEIAARRLSSPSNQRRKAPADRADEPVVTSLRLHAVCILLVLLAAGIFTLTEHDDHHQHSFWCVFEIAMQTMLVIAGSAYFRMRAALLHRSSVISPMLVMITCLSLICEPIQRMLFGTGHPFEILIMHCQCHLMLALGVCGFRIAYQRLACLIAVFLTIFCGTISNARGLVPLMALFAIVAIVWLVMAWWETVDRRRLQSDQTRIPKAWLACSIALPALAFLTATSFGSNSVTTALQGFMPSSGGTGDYSPHSRGGVNDGDALVAGNEDIKSFAPLEDAPFVDSDKPSLYDVFNDTFDKPTKIQKQDRAIAIPPDLLKHIHQKMAEAKQAGREFSLLRSEKKSGNEQIRDLQTKALFYVAGRTPLHMKTAVYGLFDGIDWAPGDFEYIDSQLRETEGRNWLYLPRPNRALDIFSGTATHSVKVANLDGNVLPAPAQLVGVNIDKVDRASMYRALDNGLVELNRETVPSMTPINFVSRCVDNELLLGSTRISIIDREKVLTMKDIFVAMPEGAETARIRAHAERLTNGMPRGWKQVTAITTHLQENYVLDRSTNVAPDSTSPVTDFLFKSRRGPEYLFASSAATMLRTLGYSTRLVGGFYASPDNYDKHKQHTTVHAADAHVWCEVSIGAQTWLTVEASPGYEVLGPPPGLLARLGDLFVTAWQWMVQNVLALSLLAIVLVVLFAKRKTIQDSLLTLRWRYSSRSSTQRRAVRLASLIDHRLRLAGIERRSGTTLKRWSTQTKLEPIRDDLRRVADIADRAMFSGNGVTTIDDHELKQLERELSYRELKRLSRSRNESTAQAV